ncbi:MAG TPA: EF-hand domain-containing protein [Xanthobacteraceae bacterium]|nr:EF-hand domain-containing protein [Xanthobacteraceae bacterium]
MLFFLGAAADGALSLLSALQQQMGASGAQGTSGAGDQTASLFTPSTAAPTSPPAGGTPPVSGGSAPNCSSCVMAALIQAQEQQQGQQQNQSDSGTTLSPRGARLFAGIDTNGDGQIDKSELENLFGGSDTTLADSIFARLDTNNDGSVSRSEFASVFHGRGHHHLGQGAPAGGLDASLSNSLQGANSSTTTNSDGSTTTTITYADGSTVTMTTPAGGTSGSGGHNLLEQLIDLQAQLSSASSNAASA